MATFDPAKIVESLIRGKGVTPTKRLTPSRAKGASKTPVAGAVDKATKTLEQALGGGGDTRTSAKAADTRTAGEKDASTAEGRAKIAKAKAIMSSRQTATSGIALGALTGKKVKSSGTEKAKMAAARKTKNKKKTRRARRRVSRRSG
jgi:hypothetical protein